MKLNLERLKSRLAAVVLDEIKVGMGKKLDAVKAAVDVAGKARAGDDLFSKIDDALRDLVGEETEPGVIDVEATAVEEPAP